MAFSARKQPFQRSLCILVFSSSRATSFFCFARFAALDSFCENTLDALRRNSCFQFLNIFGLISFAAAISSRRYSLRITSRTSFVLYSAVYVFRVMVLLLLLFYYTTFTIVFKGSGLFFGDHNMVHIFITTTREFRLN